MADYKTEQIGEVGGLGTIYQSTAPLHDQILALGEEGVEYPFLVSPEEACMIRIAEVSNDFTRTSIAPVAVEGEAPILYKLSPFMNPAMAVIAENAHRKGEYPLFNREFYEAVKDIAEQELGLEPEDRTAHTLSSKEDYNLTHGMDDTKFILGRQAREYLKKFKHSLIPLLNFPTDDIPENKCAVNYLWFFGPDLGSVLYCRLRDLYYSSRAFGVLKKSAEGASQNSGYSLTEIKQGVVRAIPKTLEELGLSENQEMLQGPLEESILDEIRD